MTDELFGSGTKKFQILAAQKDPRSPAREWRWDRQLEIASKMRLVEDRPHDDRRRGSD